MKTEGARMKELEQARLEHHRHSGDDSIIIKSQTYGPVTICTIVIVRTDKLHSLRSPPALQHPHRRKHPGERDSVHRGDPHPQGTGSDDGT